MSKKNCPRCGGSGGVSDPHLYCRGCEGTGFVDSHEELSSTPPEAGTQGEERETSFRPAMGRLVYRNYYAGDQPAVIGNMHGIDDSRLSSRDVLMDLIMRAGIQDGDEYLIAVTKIGPRFCDTQWRIGEGGQLERVELGKSIIVQP
mgnify:CR=1 FL=1